jgi:hypothetical protein
MHYFLEQEVSRPEGLCRGPIHPSAWKVNSPKLVYKALEQSPGVSLYQERLEVSHLKSAKCQLGSVREQRVIPR